MKDGSARCPYCWGEHKRARSRYCSPEHAKASARHDRNNAAARKRAAQPKGAK